MKAGEQEGGGWRVPAAELERLVAIAAKRMLEDKRLLATALEPNDLDVGQIASPLRAAEEQAKQLQFGAEMNAQLSSLIERVELRPEGLRLSIRLPISAAATPSATLNHARAADSGQAPRSREPLAHPW